MKSASSAGSHGLSEGKEYNLKIGSTFQPSRAHEAYHVMRYDFKPASVDTSRPSELYIGSNNECTVTIPNVSDSGATTYKGGKKPCTKECVLIIDKATGEITLERISSNIPLKKSRTVTDRSGENRKSGNVLLNKSTKPHASSSNKSSVANKDTAHKKESHSQQHSSASVQQHSSMPIHSQQTHQSPNRKTNGPKVSPKKQVEPKQREVSTSSTSDSSSSDSSDDSDSDVEKHAETLNAFNDIATTPYDPSPTPAKPVGNVQPPTTTHQSVDKNPSGRMPISTLQSDLHLSDSCSDSD